MKNLLFASFLLLASASQGQFTYTFTSAPDSAEVLMNGVKQCVTPCRVKYYWRMAENSKIVFSVRSEKFETWSDTIRKKPRQYEKKRWINLEPKFTVQDVDEKAPLVAFDKIMVNFKDGQKVGQKTDLKGVTEPIKWKGSIKVGDESFEQEFYRVLTTLGYNSQISESAQLFSDDDRTDTRLPRYIVGVQIEKFNISYQQVKDKDYNAGDMKGRTTIKYNWKVLDKKTGNIVLEHTNSPRFNFRLQNYQELEYVMTSFKLGLIDLLESEKFKLLISENKHDVAIPVKSDTTEKKSYPIDKVSLPKYESLSKMIADATKSCVTVITDGGIGSGVIINKDGLMLSAYHVVDGVNQIDVKFSSGLTLQAEILAYDKDYDVVLLDINGQGFSPLPLLDPTESTSLGEEIVTIGTPMDVELGQSISKGILSGKRKIEEKIFLQTDLSVSPGNSGGPLLNAKGEIIGIVDFKIVDEGAEGLGFSIPISEVVKQLNIVKN